MENETPRPLVVARCVLLDHHHRILLGYRRAAHRWECPGGKVEFQETVRMAAIRECMEECRVRPCGPPEQVGYADIKHLTKDQFAVELYLAFPDWEGEPRIVSGEKHDAWGWFSLAETRDMPLMPSCEEFLHHLLPQFLVRHSDWPPPQIPHVGPVS